MTFSDYGLSTPYNRDPRTVFLKCRHEENHMSIPFELIGHTVFRKWAYQFYKKFTNNISSDLWNRTMI